MAGQMTLGSAALSGLVRPASAAPDDAHRTLPVPAELRGLLPGRGLRRGSTVAVGAGPRSPSGGTSLVYALIAEASRAGSWCAVVGVPAFGAVAAADGGVALDRLALVPNPGPEWATVVAALIDGVDVVVLAVPDRAAVSDSVTARLAARARQRGSVLVPYGHWDGADLTLRVTRGRWEGLSAGRGRLRRREVTVVARGRGAATQPREITIWMPGFRPLTGTVAIAPLEPITLPALHAVPDPTASPPATRRQATGEPPGPPDDAGPTAPVGEASGSPGDAGPVAVVGEASGSPNAGPVAVGDAWAPLEGRGPAAAADAAHGPSTGGPPGAPAGDAWDPPGGGDPHVATRGPAVGGPHGRDRSAPPEADRLAGDRRDRGVPSDGMRRNDGPRLTVGDRDPSAAGPDTTSAAGTERLSAEPADEPDRPRLTLVAGGAR
ncbi:hypothetical protein GCM10009687_23380 [Asanoa iriomotensis]|uniref:Protein RecA n=1 Tax=Asanoa iriomotensis TaxID=234613 RepID=A0ABQ4BXA9_9ACTN|nr:hypothetical protein Air01nite_12660 [Asanoa iriomotensis]